MNISLLRAGCIATLLLILTACSPKPEFKNIDITGGTAFGKDFSLVDPDGRLRLYIKHAQGPETLAHDLKELLK